MSMFQAMLTQGNLFQWWVHFTSGSAGLALIIMVCLRLTFSLLRGTTCTSNFQVAGRHIWAHPVWIPKPAKRWSSSLYQTCVLATSSTYAIRTAVTHSLFLSNSAPHIPRVVY